MNHLKALNTLNNRYFVMRHGQSLANQQGLIVSSPDNGIGGYGLSDTGREQVRVSAQAYVNSGGTVSRILSSDFKRAQETAQIASELLGCEQPVSYHPPLRERFFGDFELGDHQHYQQVWDEDVLSADHTTYNVESAVVVMGRITSLVLSLEESGANETYLLVSHGDTLQILQTAFQKAPASQHRSMRHLETAEIRELVLTKR